MPRISSPIHRARNSVRDGAYRAARVGGAGFFDVRLSHGTDGPFFAMRRLP
jgi:hypothetical protein